MKLYFDRSSTAVIKRKILQRPPHSAVLLKYKGHFAEGICERFDLCANGLPHRIVTMAVSWMNQCNVRFMNPNRCGREQVPTKSLERSVNIRSRQIHKRAVALGRAKRKHYSRRRHGQPRGDLAPIRNFVFAAKRNMCGDQFGLPWVVSPA